MLVKNFMAENPLTVAPDTLVVDAQKIMDKERIRCLPVLDKRGKLLGLITRHTLREAQPSPATALSRQEIDYLLSKLRVEEIMIKDPILCSPEERLDKAALLMEHHRIGHLPVVDGDNRLLGIITQRDLLRALAGVLGVTGMAGLREMLGSASVGLRISLEDVPLEAGKVKEVVDILTGFGSIIYSLISLIKGDRRSLVFRVGTEEPLERVQAELKKAGFKVSMEKID
jgi:acetoin utilization protein AcuB